MPEEETPTPESPQLPTQPPPAAEGAFVEGEAVTLPCGYLRDEKVHQDARIIPMTGLTRKAIAKDSVRNNPIKVTDIILSHCLKSIGPYVVTSRVLAELVIGDRDFLILEIRKISMGTTITAGVTCETCDAKVDIKFNIDEIEVIRLVDPLGESSKIKVEDGELVYPLSGKGFSSVCRFPKGKDQELIMQMAQKNPVAASYGLYVACLREWEGKKGPFEAAFFDELSLTKIDAFEDEFMAFQPGPIMKMEAPCPSCSSDIDFTFRGSDFLFRAPKRGRI